MDGDKKNDNKSKVEGLKESFGTGRIPTQTNFIDLIDLADVGRKTLGFSESDFTQLPKPGSGLTVPATDKSLQVNIATDKSGGLKFNEHTHALELAVDENKSGLTLKENEGLKVKEGPGIQVDNSGVAVNTAALSGLDVTNGLKVKVGAGLKVGSGDGPLAVHVAKTGGLCLDDSQALSIKLAEAKGLRNNAEHGLQLEYDKDYFKVSGNGLGIADKHLAEIESAVYKAGKGALKNARDHTKDGSQNDDNPSPVPLEKDIAQALKDAYGNGYTRPKELEEIVSEGMRYLERNSDDEIKKIVIDDEKISKPKRHLVIAKRLWDDWLKPIGHIDDQTVVFSKEGLVELPGVDQRPDMFCSSSDESVVIARMDGGKIKLNPGKLGSARVTVNAKHNVAGREFAVKLAEFGVNTTAAGATVAVGMNFLSKTGGISDTFTPVLGEFTVPREWMQGSKWVRIFITPQKPVDPGADLGFWLEGFKYIHRGVVERHSESDVEVVIFFAEGEPVPESPRFLFGVLGARFDLIVRTG